MIRVNSKNKSVVDAYYNEYKSIIIHQLTKVSKIGYKIRSGKSPRQILPSAVEASFLKKLTNEKWLKIILTSPPGELVKLISFFKQIHPTIDQKNDNLNKLLRKVFIDRVYENNRMFSKYDFIENLDYHTCLYCNRNYIYYLSRNSNLKPEIDHFYPKNKYPFLGLSFYNLIPSFQTCNGIGGKHNLDPYVQGIVSPYLIKDGDFEFDYKLITSKTQGQLSGLKVEVFLRKEKSANSNAFLIDELYQKHNDHVEELIIKSKLVYHEKYRESLKSYGIQFSSSEIDRMIVGNYTGVDELHKRPLSKLYRDISIRLGLIKNEKTT